jgi:large subunit ribosomal protein L10
VAQGSVCQANPERKEETALAITREKKEAILSDYVESLQNCQGLVVTEYRGLEMEHFDAIRTKLREIGSSYTVTKNTLLKLALNEVGLAMPEELLQGPVAIGIAGENLPGTVKALMDVAKENELLILKGAIMEQNVFQEDDLKALSELPSLDELRSQLAGMVVQPASQLLGVLVAAQRDVVSVLQAYVDKHSEDESEEAA